ncbi:MAG TPA: AI-2E family transporter [Planctomycetaceae bacterium]|jgi:AI-2 transport protein TqsA|nr:AI-2E family transporter [Planctomycetaceae bacterium]
MNTNLRDEQVWLAVGSLMILATVALAGALFYTRAVMIPFVLAIFITTAVSPIVDRLVVRLRFPGWLAISIALILVLAILVLLGAALGLAVQTIINTADEYTRQVTDLTQRLFAQLHAHGLKVDEKAVLDQMKSWLPGIITTAAGTVTSLISDGLLVMFFVIFLLAGRDSHQRQTGIYAEIESAIRKYIVTKTAISAVAGVLVGTILWMMGLRMAVLFGLLAFLFNYIPNVGPIVASLLPIPIAFAQFENPWMVLPVVALPGTVHMIIGNFVEPKLMGQGLELHPVAVLLALAFLGLLWGVIGMVLAVPIAAMARIVLSRFATTRALGELLAGQLPGARPIVPMI